MRRSIFAAILCVCVLSLGCPSAPTGHSVVGLYEGYFEFDGTAVDVPTRLNLFQDSSGNVTGAWTVDFAEATSHGGTVTGTISGTTVNLTLTPTDVADPGYTLACTVETWDETDDTLVGSFTSTDSETGYLRLTRVGPA